MNYLLDTGVWLWSLAALDQLNQKAKELINEGADEIFFSAASVWEICIKVSIGKLKLPESPVDFVPDRLSKQRIQNLSITNAHALGIYSLPRHHDDPFDRMLIAQALLDDLLLVSNEQAFGAYGARLLW